MGYNFEYSSCYDILDHSRSTIINIRIEKMDFKISTSDQFEKGGKKIKVITHTFFLKFYIIIKFSSKKYMDDYPDYSGTPVLTNSSKSSIMQAFGDFN